MLQTKLTAAGHWLSPLGLRALLAWEFFEAGLQKLHGDNWFAALGDKFLFPFSQFSPGFNWTVATWAELLGSVALLLGVGTRWAAFVLFAVTIVAIDAGHWPAQWSTFAELWQGYAITDKGFGNYKLPLLFLVMLVPLMFGGAGRMSLDHFFASRRKRGASPAAAGRVLTLGVARNVP